MKKLSLFIFILGLFLVGFVSETRAACELDVSLVTQDPYPATPGSYVNLLFQVTGVQNSQCGGVKFELISDYPFSLDDENNRVRTLEGNTWVSNSYKNYWTIPYKLRVDENALDGDTQIEVRYSPKTFDSDTYFSKLFNITIEDSRTNFDAVIQEVSGSEVSIAIANIGEYAANSVVVRIPEQNSFVVTGTDGQMVGNLASGDYTIVGFTISQKLTQPKNVSKGSTPTNPQTSSNRLKFDIYYTDNLGVRRTVNMELPVNIGNSSIQGIGNFPGRTNTKSNSWKNWYTILIILAILGAISILYKKTAIKKLFKFKKKENSFHDKTPDWIRNSKEKEKNK